MKDTTQSIAAFCMTHRLPQRRTLRLVKREILRHVEDEQAWEIDLTEEIGVRAAKKADHSRITYIVTDPDLLDWCIRDTIGLDLLSDGDFERIVKAARYYHQLATGKNKEFRIVLRSTGFDFKPGAAYHHKLDEALRRIGQ